jgi:hypothetical protein
MLKVDMEALTNFPQSRLGQVATEETVAEYICRIQEVELRHIGHIIHKYKHLIQTYRIAGSFVMLAGVAAPCSL